MEKKIRIVIVKKFVKLKWELSTKIYDKKFQIFD